MSQFRPDQLALVTGAAGDIGQTVARRLAADGASVVLADLPAAHDRLDAARLDCQAVSAPGAIIDTVTFDVTEVQAVRTAFRDLATSIGVPELVCNNAGYQGEFANTADVDLDNAEQVLAVNVLGALTVIQAAAVSLRDASRSGSIVNTASMAGVSGAPNMIAYSASKAAVIAMTKSAAKDLASLGIRVNAVSPGFIGPGAMWDNQVRRQAAVASAYYADDDATVAEQMIGQVPLRRYGSLEEVAATIAFLLSDDASYLTGINIEVSGGAA